jgi:tripeptidyl-peptidase I
LSYHGIDIGSLTKSSSGDSVTLRVTVGEAEEMLGTTYNVYYHPESDDYVVRTLSYNIPTALHGHVDLVSPTTYFGTIKSMRATNHLSTKGQILQSEAERDASELLSILAVPSSCKETITPACLKALYNTTSYTPSETSKNILGIVGYLEEYANDADLQVIDYCHKSRIYGGKKVLHAALDFLQEVPHCS